MVGVIVFSLFYLFIFLYDFQVEREMCSASAEFEDFVLQFMDRCVELSFAPVAFNNAIVIAMALLQSLSQTIDSYL